MLIYAVIALRRVYRGRKLQAALRAFLLLTAYTAIALAATGIFVLARALVA